jgi:hypothetical protein
MPKKVAPGKSKTSRSRKPLSVARLKDSDAETRALALTVLREQIIGARAGAVLLVSDVEAIEDSSERLMGAAQVLRFFFETSVPPIQARHRRIRRRRNSCLASSGCAINSTPRSV